MSATNANPKSDEPAVAQEEDVAVDRKDIEGEELIRQVRNDRLGKEPPAPAKPSRG